MIIISSWKVVIRKRFKMCIRDRNNGVPYGKYFEAARSVPGPQCDEITPPALVSVISLKMPREAM